MGAGAFERMFFIRFCGIIVHAVVTGFAFHGIAVKKRWRYLALATVLHICYNLFFPTFYMMLE